MPELPEVETTRRGIEPHTVGQRISRIVVRQPRLRWPVPARLADILHNQRLDSLERRGKYLLFRFASGTLLLHLGMSGSLRVVDGNAPPETHDHVDLVFSGGSTLRLRDPRRFGAVLWTEENPLHHPLLRHLGPEPLSDAFSPQTLIDAARRRSGPVKSLLMDGRVVVGVGNIYANEALFRSGIRPSRAANRIGSGRYERLHGEVQAVLREAIAQGGTTLRDFVSATGSPGYFRIALKVYGRGAAPCPNCGRAIRSSVIGQRATYYCVACQT